jgi:hypothetical protein
METPPGTVRELGGRQLGYPAVNQQGLPGRDELGRVGLQAEHISQQTMADDGIRMTLELPLGKRAQVLIRDHLPI